MRADLRDQMKRLLLAGVFALSVTLVGGLKSTSAQYPPVVGSIGCNGTATVSQQAATLLVTAVVVDPAGQPVPGVTVNFQILSQPGNTASVSATSGLTGADGKATITLFTGSESGSVTVGCEAVLSDVSGVDDPQSQFIAEVEGSFFIPPKTGDAGLKR